MCLSDTVANGKALDRPFRPDSDRGIQRDPLTAMPSLWLLCLAVRAYALAMRSNRGHRLNLMRIASSRVALLDQVAVAVHVGATRMVEPLFEDADSESPRLRQNPWNDLRQLGLFPGSSWAFTYPVQRPAPFSQQYYSNPVYNGGVNPFPNLGSSRPSLTPFMPGQRPLPMPLGAQVDHRSPYFSWDAVRYLAGIPSDKAGTQALTTPVGEASPAAAAGEAGAAAATTVDPRIASRPPRPLYRPTMQLAPNPYPFVPFDSQRRAWLTPEQLQVRPAPCFKPSPHLAIPPRPLLESCLAAAAASKPATHSLSFFCARFCVCSGSSSASTPTAWCGRPRRACTDSSRSSRAL
jgi:hypothetical protein